MTRAVRNREALLRFIAGYLAANHGVAPSIRECALGIGVSKSRVHAHLRELEQRGTIRRLSHRERAIDLLSPVAVPSIDGAPLYAVPMRLSSFERYSGERL